MKVLSDVIEDETDLSLRRKATLLINGGSEARSSFLTPSRQRETSSASTPNTICSRL